MLTVAALTSSFASATGACSATVSPHTVDPASGANFTISVTNTGPSDIQWIDFTVPSSNFTYGGNSISGWSTADHAGGTSLSGNTLSQGQTADFSLVATTDITTAPAANWQVQVSDDGSGANPTSCSGDLGTSISGHPPNDSANGVSNVSASTITTSSAKITWNSDNPTSSIVYYGKTTDYGSTSSYDSDLGTSHSIMLTGLSPGTGYHFQVAGSDGQGNYVYSADNTFLTVAAPISKTPNPTQPSQSVVVDNDANDHVPPQISLSTQLSGAYKTVPAISGTASDDKAVAKVEYSTDGGKNWLPVDTLTTAGQPKVTFAFTPTLPQDGNYTVLARATDIGGNTTTTAAQTLVIDRLPPLVGGNVFNVGPQIVQPGTDGTLKAIVGVDQKVTVSAVGGPTSITLTATTSVATKTGSKPFSQSFSLALSEDTGLWSGIVSFTRSGIYTLAAHGIDGAGNQTDRTLSPVYVASPGHTLDTNTHKPISSTVTVYYLEPETHSWVVWDGNAFGQRNPQKTDMSGAFSMFLPPGKYYLHASAPGYHTFISNIFDTTQSTPLISDLNLSPWHGPHLGSHYAGLPSLSIQHISLTGGSKNIDHNDLIGKQLPAFKLTDTTGATVQPADLLGRPTLLSFNATWSPTTAEQLDTLSSLQANPNFNILPVALQEGSGRVQAYTDIAAVKLRWLVDPDSTLSTAFNVQSLPMHYFVDRKGIVKHVVVGVLNQQQIENILTGL